MGLTVVSLTMFIYFVIIVYFLEALQATSGKELSSNTIAIFSLIGSVLGSFVGGAFLGRFAPSHPTRFAVVVGITFMILQVNQLKLFRGIPVWFTILSILSYPPCCVYAAQRIAARRPLTPKVEECASALSATDTAAAAPTDAAEPPSPTEADGEAAAAQEEDAGGGGDGAAMATDGGASAPGGGEAPQ